MADTVLEMRRLSTAQADFSAQLERLTAIESSQDESVERTVGEILSGVRRGGDAALLEYTERFDRLKAARVSDLELPGSALAEALAALGAEQRSALEQAAARVRSYHERQLALSWQYTESDGTVLGQRVTPLDRVGLYVPGGKAAYPSSVLMNALPAKVAGVAELVMVVPTPGGERNALVLAAGSAAAATSATPATLAGRAFISTRRRLAPGRRARPDQAASPAAREPSRRIRRIATTARAGVHGQLRPRAPPPPERAALLGARAASASASADPAAPDRIPLPPSPIEALGVFEQRHRGAPRTDSRPPRARPTRPATIRSPWTAPTGRKNPPAPSRASASQIRCQPSESTAFENASSRDTRTFQLQCRLIDDEARADRQISSTT